MRRLFVLATLLPALPASAVTQYYDNLAAWQAAVGPHEVGDLLSNEGKKSCD